MSATNHAVPLRCPRRSQQEYYIFSDVSVGNCIGGPARPKLTSLYIENCGIFQGLYILFEIINRTGCISRHFQNKCLFIFIYLNLTIWWLLRWMLCVDRIFSYSRYNTANEKVSKFNWYSQEKVRKKSGNFILRCVWEPCHYLLQEIIQTVIKLW